jgi:Type IV pilin-like G and H, putative
MKILLRSTLLLCFSLSWGKPILAESTSIPTIAPTNPSPSTTQPTLMGTWSADTFGKEVIIVFDQAGTVNFLGKKIDGDYEYYQFADTSDYRLMQQVASGKFAIEPSPRYKVQGNIVEVTLPDGTTNQVSLDFTDNGRTVNFKEKSPSNIIFTLKRVSNDSEVPKNTESLATAESHFHGLSKLIALQVAQADYWTKKRNFAKELQSLKVKPLPDSDRSYQYKLIKQSQRQSIVAAIPTQPNLRSFVLQLDRVGRRQQPFNGIICATDRPSEQLAPSPQFKNKGLTCPATTHEVDFNTSIRQSLLKMK